MIDPARFLAAVANAGVEFVSGVPDSLLKQVCLHIEQALPNGTHVIAANEGGALALAAGHHLATGSVPLVYLQNSGLGNVVNPLLSLADPEVYALPIVLLIGWRGEPGVSDEPQHVKQGRVTPSLLDAMEVPYRVLADDEAAALAAASWAVATARQRSAPVALIVRKGAFGPAAAHERGAEPRSLLTRERAIEIVVGAIAADALVVATTGMIARELYEFRRRSGDDGRRDFLTVGSMGHASQIALGIACALPARRVVCLDGDGAVLMHMGGMATIGASAPHNYLHVVLNNGAHDSVGGQATVALSVSLPGVARACGYAAVMGPVEVEDELAEAVSALQAGSGPSFLEVRVAKGARPDLGRPKEAPRENKRRFVDEARGVGDRFVTPVDDG